MVYGILLRCLTGAAVLFAYLPESAAKTDGNPIRKEIQDTAYTVPSPDTVSIIFLGDIMQHTAQYEKARELHERKYPVSQGFDYSGCFPFIKDDLESADIAVANMEAPVGAPPYRGYPSFSAPGEIAEEAFKNGIDIFLTANNHICDRGKAGFEGSIAFYRKNGIPFTGIALEGEEERNNPLVFECKGIRFGIINFTYGTNGIGTPEGCHVARMDSTEIKSAIMKARLELCDIIIAAPHWGVEYTLKPHPEQKAWEKMLLRNGVDIIIGSHPHTPQPVTERISPDGKIKSVTAYSLGNALSNMTAPFTRTGLMVKIKIAKPRYGWEPVIAETEIIPIWTSRPGGISENYSIVPIKKYLNRPELFKDRNDYLKMKEYYNRLTNLDFENARKKN